MATIYTHKDTNIRKTYALFALFFGAIIGIGWFFSYVYNDPGILFFAVIFSSIMSFLSYWHSDKIVLRMAKASPISKESNRELYNIVENLAITAGMPIPKIYLVDEPAPNAFATGRDPEHGVVAVTSGLLRRLNKSELEGVIAHEMAHIANRDTLISTVAIILVGFISLISDIFMRSMLFGGFRSRDNNSGRAGGVMLIIGIAVAILAPISAMLMQLAISRKREFLADASGALLTRYPEGLASALEKIASDPTELRAATNTNSHLWFDDPFTHGIGDTKKVSFLHKLFMTHPPAEERIGALRGMK